MSEYAPKTYADRSGLSWRVTALLDHDDLGGYIGVWWWGSSLTWRRVLLFEQGVISFVRSPYLRSTYAEYRWADVDAIRTDIPSSVYTENGSVLSQMRYRIRLRFADGRSCRFAMADPEVRTLENYFVHYGPRTQGGPQGDLFRWISTRVADAQAERIKARIEAGETVGFGAVSATKEGIAFQALSRRTAPSSASWASIPDASW